MSPSTTTTPEANPPGHGLLVSEVLPGSNAAKAGVHKNDVLLTYAGTKLTSANDLSGAISRKNQDQSRTRSPVEGPSVQLWRNGKELSLVVAPGSLGARLAPGSAGEAIRSQREGDHALRASQGKSFKQLPGTRIEVNALGQLFDKPLVLLGADASEQRLDELAKKDELRHYRYLHFATHGDVNDAIALDSALILSQNNLPDPVQQMLAHQHIYDGRLTAGEIVERWKLDADLVVLSACQTGLGQQAGGEGYLGFAQALFLAGARSLVVSLWKVDDTATALLMTRFYQNLLGKRSGLQKPMPKAEALAEAKRWLRTLPADEVARLKTGLPRDINEVQGPPPDTAKSIHTYEHPYYWASFILIGAPN
jgi:CHAT domain-containing protein